MAEGGDRHRTGDSGFQENRDRDREDVANLGDVEEEEEDQVIDPAPDLINLSSSTSRTTERKTTTWRN